jgi:hypothetical protein
VPIALNAESSQRVLLSRELGDFLIELSIASQRSAMCPVGHPSLGECAGQVMKRVSGVLLDRAKLSIGVARRQLCPLSGVRAPHHAGRRRLSASEGAPGLPLRQQGGSHLRRVRRAAKRRPYRDAWPAAKVTSYIMERAGLEIDPDHTRSFTEMMTRADARVVSREETDS